MFFFFFFFFSSRRRHTRLQGDWSSDVCSSDLLRARRPRRARRAPRPRVSADPHDGPRARSLAHADADRASPCAARAHARADRRGQRRRRAARGDPGRGLRGGRLAPRQADRPVPRDLGHPRRRLLRAVPLGAPPGLLQERQQPHAERARSAVASAGAQGMRVRMPKGIVSAARARLLGEITREAGRASGRPIADVTTRQQIQLRWVTLENVPEVIARLEAAGLSSLQTGMDNIRGIIGCPATGLTPGELLDTAPIATAFQKIFLGNKEFTNLPRKFNVTITSCLEHCTGGETQDISLTPAVAGHEPGFNLAVGGKQGSGGPVFATPLDAFVRPDEAADVCAAIALVFRDHGPRESRSKARLAFLLEVWGAARMRAELDKRLGRSLPPAGADARLATHTDHVGIFRQKQAGLNYVGLKTPVGRLTGEQLLELARLAEQYGRGELRFTPLQNVLLPHVPDARLGDLTQEPLLRVLPYNPSEVARGLVACTGTDFCNLALIDTKTRAVALTKEFEARFGSRGRSPCAGRAARRDAAIITL